MYFLPSYNMNDNRIVGTFTIPLQRMAAARLSPTTAQIMKKINKIKVVTMTVKYHYLRQNSVIDVVFCYKITGEHLAGVRRSAVTCFPGAVQCIACFSSWSSCDIDVIEEVQRQYIKSTQTKRHGL